MGDQLDVTLIKFLCVDSNTFWTAVLVALKAGTSTEDVCEEEGFIAGETL